MENVFDSDVQNGLVGERSFEENYTYELANDSPTTETLITEKENMYMEVGDADIIVQPDENTPSVMIQASTSVKSTPQVSHKSIPDNKSKTIKRKRSGTTVRALTLSNIAEKYNELSAARLRIAEMMERDFVQKNAEHLKRMELLDLEIALKNKKLTQQCNLKIYIGHSAHPRAKTRTSNRGRKPTRANVITSSPYKNQLTESLRLAETRGQSRRGGRSRGRGRGLGRSQGGVCSSNKANRQQNVDTSSSSSESDAIVETDSEYDEQVNSDTPESLDTSCIFCGMNYSSDTHGEEWIQCLSCSLWLIQSVQALKAKNYICDFCR
ncbi:hypothetical protein FQA39_LY10962 [Lamprigera yunnana]|nr:hypothetical protein FQA39_LY10962 [Lamprigera yunnana]